MKAALRACTLLCVLSSCPLLLFSQTTISFSVSQPTEPFSIDAGQNQIYIGNDLTLGGEPTSSGGFEDYTYSWEPAEFLNNPAAANPTASGITAPITFTLICTDIIGDCVKEDEVFVDYQLATSAYGNPDIQAHPNPFGDFLIIESDLPILMLSVFDISGKVVSTQSNPPRKFQWETSHLNNGIYLIKVQLENGFTKNFKLCKRD